MTAILELKESVAKARSYKPETTHGVASTCMGVRVGKLCAQAARAGMISMPKMNSVFEPNQVEWSTCGRRTRAASSLSLANAHSLSLSRLSQTHDCASNRSLQTQTSPRAQPVSHTLDLAH
eukprot:6213687-Pleurochrysis_carterae.AAC.2